MPNPSERPIPSGHITKARSWLKARGRGDLPTGLKTQRDMLEAVLAMHGRTWQDTKDNDVAEGKF